MYAGYGVRVVDFLFARYDVPFVRGHATSDSIGFWHKIGAVRTDGYPIDIEGY